MHLEISGLILLIIVLNSFLSIFSKRNVLACGLVGFSGTNNFDILKIKFLLYWNSIERGTDATGIFTPKSGLIKDNTRAEFFINDWRYIDKVREDNVMVAHVRAKTFGANTAKNAHPFEYNKLIGAHNGTLKNHHQIGNSYNLDMVKYDVDSQVLISALSLDFKKNIEDKFRVLNKYEGAAALLFYDNKEEVLYACHDKERPLFYGYVGEKRDMYISSIKDSLEAIGCEGINAFPINVVHKIKDGVILERTTYQPAETKIYPTIATFNSIKYELKNGVTITTLPEHCKGIQANAIDPELMVGYWFRIDNSLACNSGFEMGHWYLCTGVKEGILKSVDKPMFINTNEEELIGAIHYVDTTNFIPVKDSYVKLMCKLVSTKNPGKVMALKGEVCRVHKYIYGEDKVEIKNPTTGRIITVDVNCVRNMTFQEVTAYEDAVKAFILQEALLAEENKGTAQDFIDSLDDKIEDKSPFTADDLNDLLKNKNEDLIPPVEEADFDEEPEDLEDDSEEIFIPHNMYCDLIDNIRIKVQDIHDDHDEAKYADVSDKLDDLEDFLGKSYDINYLEEELQK